MKRVNNKKEEQVKKETKTSKKEIINKQIKDFNKSLDKKLNEQKFNLLELILLIVVAFVFGIFISEAFVYEKGTGSNLKNQVNVSEIQKVYNSLAEKYYKDLDSEKLTEAAINGMLNYLADGYSVYYDSKETADFNEKTEGTYYGLGMEVTQDVNKKAIISTVFPETPAEKAGLKVSDVITKVGETDVTSYLLEDIVSLIKGKGNKKITITIQREEEVLTKNLVTAKIDIPSVTTEVIEEDGKKIGYMYISIFASNSDEQFEKELIKLEKTGIDSLIIDVRDNIGGHLVSVRNILDLFFDKDDPLYQINKKNKITKTYDEKNSDREYPVVVLINGNSASGSEILASAFKEVKHSEIVGTTTFGKGTVQQVIDLSSGGVLKLTTETWLTALGNEINKIGVKPTIEVKLSDDYIEEPIKENDNQFQKALEILKK